MRVACVIVPHLALQLVCRKRPDLAQQPVIIPDPQNPRRVFDLSLAAHNCGVSPGMSVRTAVGLCSTAAIVTCDAPLIDGAFASLVDVMASMSPAVELLPPDTFYLGIARGWGGISDETALLHSLLLAIRERTGLRVRSGSGAGRFTARVAAMLAEDDAVRTIAPGDEGATLAPLPIALLPCSAEIERRLQLYGLRTLGDIATLPAGPLQAQFGPEGL
ncbi:MAG TPA: DNA polymerase Y family protein, partial [Dehalococcoidia bacterium]|nr:DNA polymerase Y family protein [Dehalococcoidia bacterium]